ncbi:uncharacterized protein GGS22DRAFT_194343 [Annulohypoxylon maeteangense]|uniref:uncharacterized protein n=1 Tax=Annulohypoxylon maeteangense TaxID=1927788 RepID=UPI0020075A66|nr:uncharacterized protein GGS22DRAFT_194343 [Annulohypoxylon maeteangense]KAI0890146.1 hypothetical protein GGS22DRAFT_194343 [Annulohypoxylon maeteangense]
MATGYNKNCCTPHLRSGSLGAAGLIIHRYRDTGEVEMLIGQRAPGNDHAGEWGTIGGRLENGETVYQCVMRQVEYKIGIRPGNVLIPTAMTADDHDAWTYTTLFAEPAPGLEVKEFKLETSKITNVRWVSRQELRNYDLHPAFEYYLCALLYILLPPDLDPVTGDIVRPRPIGLPRVKKSVRFSDKVEKFG